MQSDCGRFDAIGFKLRQNFFVKMQASCRRSNGPGIFGVDGLVACFVIATWGMRNVRRQREQAIRRSKLPEVLWFIGGQSEKKELAITTRYLYGERIGQAQTGSGFRRFAGANLGAGDSTQPRAIAINALNQHFHLPARIFLTEKAGA